ncbi:MAG: SpaH/EbpB family LPXTG-anchored major pilin [Acutalibacteraceae bacterium]|nr:SpaH/EbpB family LPXTG-anchored major pilin [Acutalibacteraceae bacterium]
MKKTVRILSVLLAVIMVCMSFAVSASAAATSKLTLKSTKDGFTFSIFKLADLNTTTGEFKANDNLDAGIKAEVKTALSAVKSTQAELELKSAELADKIDDTLQGKSKADQTSILGGAIDTFAVSEGNHEKTFEALSDGIYYIFALNGDTPQNVTKNQGSIITLPEYNMNYDKNDLSTLWNRDVTISLEVKAASDTVDVSKTIVPSSNYTTSTNKDAAITDETTPVVFELKASVVGSKEQPLKTYVIGDNMDDGLTYVAGQTPVVKLAKAGAADYVLNADQFTYVPNASYKDGAYTYTFAIELKNTVFASNAEFNGVSFYDYDEVVVQYKATINENIEVKSAENNTDYLLYQNNSGNFTEVEGTTVKVYTLGVNVSKYDAAKYDADDTAKTFLAGATFGLYNANGELVAKAVSTEAGNDKFFTLDASNNMTKNEYNVKPAKYTIKELEAPAGYTLNTNPIVVDVNASVSSTTITTTNTGYYAYECGNTPIILPATGGAGTVMFTVAGASLIAIAGVLFFVVMRKKSATK